MSILPHQFQINKIKTCSFRRKFLYSSWTGLHTTEAASARVSPSTSADNQKRYSCATALTARKTQVARTKS